VEKSSPQHLKDAEAEIQQLKSVSSFAFPENYSLFATQIGGGSQYIKFFPLFPCPSPQSHTGSTALPVSYRDYFHRKPR
jgi:hypothetical protein